MDAMQAILPDGTPYTAIHFAFFDDCDSIPAGKREIKIACTPNLLDRFSESGKPHRWSHSGEPSAVTCTLCKNTAAYRDRVEEMKQQVVIRMLKDGTGRVCIHFFVHDDRGPAVTPAAEVRTAVGTVQIGGSTGYIACQPQRADVTPRMVGNTIQPLPHSNDGRAVTCPECMATEAYKEWMKGLEDVLETSQ
jgi:hypothetical protein